MRAIPDNNLLYPVLITNEDETSGSGFLFRQPGTRKLFLATALHVLFHNDGNTLISGILDVSIPDRDLSRTPAKISLDLDKLRVRRSSNADVTVIEIGAVGEDDLQTISLLDGAAKTSRGKSILTYFPQEHFIRLDEVLISNDVFVLGYPNSLGLDDEIQKDKPLLRKGIVAGINYKNKTIIIDCPVYFGNSGGLILQQGENDDGSKTFNAIGIVTNYIPFVEHVESNLGYKNVSYQNSGYAVVVPTDTIYQLTEEAPIEVGEGTD